MQNPGRLALDACAVSSAGWSLMRLVGGLVYSCACVCSFSLEGRHVARPSARRTGSSAVQNAWAPWLCSLPAPRSLTGRLCCSWRERTRCQGESDWQMGPFEAQVSQGRQPRRIEPSSFVEHGLPRQSAGAHASPRTTHTLCPTVSSSAARQGQVVDAGAAIRPPFRDCRT